MASRKVEDFDEFCDPDNPKPIKQEDVLNAVDQLLHHIVYTPCVPSHYQREFVMPLHYKLEILQKSGSFKERGALYALLQLPLDKKKTGVVIASLGNEAAGMCYHAAKLSVPVIVVMPHGVPICKLQKCHSLGAKVVVQGNNLMDSQRYARAIARDKGLTYINGRDHPDVLAGYGTIGLEILEQVPLVDAVLVPVGCGGLAAAVATIIKRVKPNCLVYMIPEEVKYYVVELSEDSLKSKDKYVCIPFSWMKYRETEDGEVLIKYPIEKKSVTKRRVQNREESSDDWPIFSAEIKLGTNFYKEATNYIRILKKISKQESKKIGEIVPSTSGLISETTSNQTSEQESTASKECQEETKFGDSPKARRYFTRLTSKMSSPANTVGVDQTVENDSPKTSSCSKENVQYSQKENSLVQNYEKFTEEYILREALRDVMGDDYKEIVSMLYAEYCKRYRLFQMLCHDALEHCKTFKKLKKISDGDNDGQEVIPNKKKKVTWSEVQNNDDDTDVTDEDDNIESENNNPSDKIRGQARKFILPPEYDPEDSKWTLKHREYKEGLVELMPKSHIYVDAVKLRHCKNLARDSKSLARMLLVEVFRESALSICSPTGKKANAFTGTGMRPGLDEHARNVLLKFVDQHTVAQKWVRLDRAVIMNTLRNKMQEMRGKYG